MASRWERTAKIRTEFFFYDETIRVPLLIKLPGASATGKTLRRESESRRGWSWRM